MVPGFFVPKITGDKMDKNSITIKSGIPELGIFEKNLDAWVSSRKIAEMFGKEHKHVMEIIDKKLKPNLNDDYNGSNFRPVKRKDKKGEMRPEYLLNRKSFTLVVMGFTGRKALEFKVAYVDAFEAMISLIDTRILSKEGYKEMTSAIASKYGTQSAFALEANMINKIILGMKASEFKELNCIDGENTRDSVVSEKLEMLDKAQRLNAQLIIAGLDFETRKTILESNYKGK